MKKSLLFLSGMLMLTAINMKAQTNLVADKVWDLGNDAIWTGYAGAPAGSTIDIKDNLGIFPHSTSSTLMGLIVANTSTPNFSDGYTYVQRMNFGGSSNNSGVLPTQRYLTFKVSTSAKIKIWVKNGSTTAARNVYLSDGTAILATAAMPVDATSPGYILTYDYTGTSGKTFYISNDASTYIYKIDVDVFPFAVLATSDVKTKNTFIQVLTEGNQVIIKKAGMNSAVEVYNMNGSLVKSFKMKGDTNFTLERGVYIINVKSEKGEISEKVLIK